ncbi:hypothetical protein NliqN6_0362 [Naganishia liquefaciens]|uniref:Rhodanese domain-containing protein n=1 Tax=Naganishia liquefaciens TaxID=104408 RepID=A0A8H3TMS8_9TREE|nr:hypothetical protein NliqN6_0362 [Naganishia liquefaciens]
MSTFANFFDRFPPPKATVPRLDVEELAALMASDKVAGRDYVVVDVRRTDLEEEVHFVHPSAINLPAQSFYQTLPTSGRLLSTVPQVIFHCTSSNGRGPRCAGWYAEWLAAEGIEGSKAYVLTGGIKAWLASEYGLGPKGKVDVLGDYREART